jgi:hypothetical protein
MAKVWIKVCNVQSALKNGRNCVLRPTALTGYAKPPKKRALVYPYAADCRSLALK